MERFPTISYSPSAFYGNGWRPAIGKKLTNRRIAQLMKQGYYQTNGVKLEGRAGAKQRKKQKEKALLKEFLI